MGRVPNSTPHSTKFSLGNARRAVSVTRTSPPLASSSPNLEAAFTSEPHTSSPPIRSTVPYPIPMQTSMRSSGARPGLTATVASTMACAVANACWGVSKTTSSESPSCLIQTPPCRWISGMNSVSDSWISCRKCTMPKASTTRENPTRSVNITACTRPKRARMAASTAARSAPACRRWVSSNASSCASVIERIFTPRGS